MYIYCSTQKKEKTEKQNEEKEEVEEDETVYRNCNIYVYMCLKICTYRNEILHSTKCMHGEESKTNNNKM